MTAFRFFPQQQKADSLKGYIALLSYFRIASFARDSAIVDYPDMFLHRRAFLLNGNLYSMHQFGFVLERVQMQERCQVFTPKPIVRALLDSVGYRSSLFGKRICDNSCGSGNILLEVVHRYIADCLINGIDLQAIRRGLERDIVGFDIDAACCEVTRIRLDEVAASYGLHDVEWRVLCVNALNIETGRYDFIVGNPPYITYRNIDAEERKKLREEFLVCSKGKFDYYYAFFESGIERLSDEGLMCYIVPNSCFKNVFASELRRMIAPLVTDIYDYGSLKVFPALTSSAIVVLSNQGNKGAFRYHSLEEGKDLLFSAMELGEDKWIFAQNPCSGITSKLGDRFRASSPIATLCNDVFIINSDDLSDSDTDCFYVKGGLAIEKKAMKRAVSPKSLSLGRNEYIVFPYKCSSRTVERMSEEAFKKTYPKCFAYLLSRKDDLTKRSADGGSMWFEFGRSQGLSQVEKNKLVLSTVVTGKVRVHEVGPGVVPYAGIVVTAVDGEKLADAKSILMSADFLEYVKSVGTNVGGHSLRITAKDVNSYPYTIEGVL